MPNDTPGRKRTTISISRELAEWLEAQIGPGLRYYNYSHALDAAVAALQEKTEIYKENVRLKQTVAELRGHIAGLAAKQEGKGKGNRAG